MKRTFKPSIISRKRTHGFLTRNNNKKGKLVLLRRQDKGRRILCR